MSRWNIAEPVGSDDKNLVATRIKEGKAAMQEALQSGGHFPGATPSAPVYITNINGGVTASRPATLGTSYAGRWYVNSETGRIERDNGTDYVYITENKDVIPAGTKLMFLESAAPTGWTQVTSGVDDKMIRITTSTGGGAGGSHSISSPPTHTHTVGNTDVLHQHTLNRNLVDVGLVTPPSGITAIKTVQSSTENGANYLTHSHPITAEQGYKPKYVDGIICTKDAW